MFYIRINFIYLVNMNLNNREIKIISFYLLGFCLILFVLKLFFFNDLLSQNQFLNWDAAHYNSIRKDGYEGFLVAFFPLFPLIWKWTHLGVFGVVVLNAFIYLISFYLLIKRMKVDVLETVLYLSVPSAIFYYLPYTESLFFMSSTMLILGVKNDKLYQVLIGLFFCTLSRPSFTVLIPSLILLELLTYKNFTFFVKRFLSYFSVCLVAILIVAYVQYLSTGKWFEFFSVQQGWGNELQVPSFPLTSWGGNMIVRLDGVAFVFGILSGVLLLLNLLKVKLVSKLRLPNEVLLSLSYLGGITLIVLLFRGGSLFSLNRFVFAAPFILIVVNYYLNKDFYFSKKQIFILFISLILYWLFFGSYVHIQAFLKYTLVSIYLLLFFLIKLENRKWNQFYIISFISINFFFQVYFFIHFLMSKGSEGWVG